MNEYIEFKEEYPFIEWNDQFIKEYFIFCESDDNVTEDIEESAPGPYEQWLKLNDYDPKTNTISTGFNRVNVGKIGSNKERNRLNQFLKKNDFDPKTGTYRSDIKLQDGSYARVPLNIGVDMTKEDNIPGGYASFRHARLNFPSYEKTAQDAYNNTREERNQYTLNAIKDVNGDIKRTKDRLNDPELSDDDRRLATEDLKGLYAMRKWYVDELKKIERPKESYSKRQQNYLTKNGSVNLSKNIASSKPRQSFSVLKHEEGHADDFMHDRSINKDVEQKNLDNVVPRIKKTRINRDALNDHDLRNEERYADIYSAKHNPYVKSSDDAFNTKTNELNHLDRTDIYNSIRNGKKTLKNLIKHNEAPQELIDTVNKAIASERQKAASKNRTTNYARADMLKAHLDADPEFQKTESPYHSKTNKERSQERKDRGELPRKQKKQIKKQNVVKEYMI